MRLLLQIEGLQTGLNLLGLPAPPVTWVDDVAIPVVTQHCFQLEDVLKQVARSSLQVFRQAGLALNFSSRKTEAVVSFRDAQAPMHRHALFVERLGRLDLGADGIFLACVGSYEHLGTTFTSDGLLRDEIAHRRTRAIQAYRQVSKGIFRNRHIAVPARLKLFESLIMPILLHGAGNWGLLPARSFNSLHACIMSWQRSIINDGFWTDNQHTDFSLQCAWKLPPLAVRLAKARLLYAFHWAKDGPRLLVDYATANKAAHGWFQALRHALGWLATLDSHFCPPDLQASTPEIILAWLTQHGNDGPRIVRRMYKKCLMQNHVLGDVVDLHAQLKQTLERHGVTFEQQTSCPTQQTDRCLQCSWCAHTFDQPQKLQAHLWVAHQIISDERKFVFSDTCLACRMCFWSAARLQQHLRLSRRQANGCYEQLTWRYTPLKISCPADVPEDLRGFRRLPATLTVSTSSSPMDTIVTSRQDALLLWDQAWKAEGLPDTLSSHISDMTIAFADSTVRNWSPHGVLDIEHVTFTISAFVDEDDEKLWAFYLWCRDCLAFSRFPHLDVVAFQQLKLALHDLVEATPLGRLHAWRDRMDQAIKAQAGENQAKETVNKQALEQWIDPFAYQIHDLGRGLNPVQLVPDCSRVPVSFEHGKMVIWILHLFSGRRRRGDCHFWVDCLQGFIPQCTIKILSVDTAVHETQGNLDRGRIFTQLLAIVRKRFFASSLTGPPCETFSAARHLVIPGTRHPRPLRDVQTPWLLPERTLRELYQTLVGSRLFLHSLIVEVEVVLAGGGTLMEHPREHPNEDRASVWRLPCHRLWIMNLPNAYEHHIEQWRYGSPGVKPTTLRAVNFGPAHVVERALLDGVDSLRVKPQNPLRGKSSDGRFKTAAAKEYPSSLCRSLVIAALSGLKYRLEHGGWIESDPLTPDETAWITSMHNSAQQATLSGTYLPDFQG